MEEKDLGSARSEDSFKIKELIKQTGHHRKIKLTSNHGNGPLRSFGNRDFQIWQCVGTENVKKAIGLIRKTTTLYAEHSFFAQFYLITARLRRKNC